MISKVIKSNRGFSAIELLLVLGVISSIIYMSLNLTNSWLKLVSAQTAAKEAYSYSKAVARYITTHQNTLINLLNPNGAGSLSLIVTISPQVLVNEGYISNLVSTANILKQKPCTIIFYQNNYMTLFYINEL